VQLGVRRGAQVQITQGVAEGDSVVVAGQQRLQKDGTREREVDMSKPGGPGGKPGGKPGAAPGGARPEGAPASPKPASAG
jgi:membrane fusion protein (multidrug efflux system)